jgi:hypothetical protein
MFPLTRNYVELGQTRISLPRNGIYRAITSMRVLLATLRYPLPCVVFAEVDAINTVVTRTLVSMGFSRFAPPRALEDLVLSSLPIDKTPLSLGYDFLWFKVTRRTVAYARRQTRRFLDRGLAATRDGIELHPELVRALAPMCSRSNRATGNAEDTPGW